MSFHICNYVSTQKTLLQWSAANLKISYIGIYIVKNYVFLVYLPLFFPYFWISIHHIECPEGPNIPIIQPAPFKQELFSILSEYWPQLRRGTSHTYSKDSKESHKVLGTRHQKYFSAFSSFFLLFCLSGLFSVN